MAILKVHDLDQLIAMSVFMAGLQKNDLKRSLVKSNPKDFNGMLEKVRKYTNLEEAFAEAPPPPSMVIKRGRVRSGPPRRRIPIVSTLALCLGSLKAKVLPKTVDLLALKGEINGSPHQGVFIIICL